jgi:hypothetical protein
MQRNLRNTTFKYANSYRSMLAGKIPFMIKPTIMNNN